MDECGGCASELETKPLKGIRSTVGFGGNRSERPPSSSLQQWVGAETCWKAWLRISYWVVVQIANATGQPDDDFGTTGPYTTKSAFAFQCKLQLSIGRLAGVQ